MHVYARILLTVTSKRCQYRKADSQASRHAGQVSIRNKQNDKSLSLRTVMTVVGAAI